MWTDNATNDNNDGNAYDVQHKDQDAFNADNVVNNNNNNDAMMMSDDEAS